MDKVIKNGTIITEAESFITDILIQHGKITALGNMDDRLDNAHVIDAHHQLVMPGAVDVHTHIDLQAGQFHTTDDFFTGTRAALCGGTTSVIEHLAFGPKGCSLHHQIDAYQQRAASLAVGDYGLHGVIQHVDESVLREMGELVQEGITSFKIYLTYNFALKDDDVLRIMRRANELHAVIAVHCENDALVNYGRRQLVDQGKTAPYYHAVSRPNECEAEAISRMLHIAHMAGDAPVYIVHISTAEGVQAIREARARGQKHIYAETCPQYLLLTQDCYYQEDALKYVMSPPLRHQSDCHALWQGLADGTIDVVATDHCPFNYRTDKQAGNGNFTKCPNGAPGIEERVMLLFSEGVQKGRISLQQFVKLLCSAPAKIYGAYPQKGCLLPGSDADLMMIDPNVSSEIRIHALHGAADYTLYEGWKLNGDITTVLSRGDIVYQHHVFTGTPGRGRFISRHVTT